MGVGNDRQMIAMLDVKYVDEQFDTWLAYHLSVCAEKTIIDMSNHVVMIGKKN